MKTGARIAALAEILENFFKSLRPPLDYIMRNYFLTRRYIGAKDRNDITHHAFNFFRHWETINYAPGLSTRAQLILYLKAVEKWTEEDFENSFNGKAYSLAPLTASEKLLSQRVPLPEWALANVPFFMWNDFKRAYKLDALKHAQALNKEASLDLRINTLKATREQVLKELATLSIDAVPTPYSEWGIRLKKRINLTPLNLFKKGWIEIQDEGSQLFALFCRAKAGEKVLDLCAGAGGKALALAAMMNNKGLIIATDKESSRLHRSESRLNRSGASIINLKNWPLSQKDKEQFDLVVVDAPCSGSGTWRRAPDLRARFTVADLNDILKQQQALLQEACQYVRAEGGRLVYGTCSVLPQENEEQVRVFLESSPEFQLVNQMRLSPLTHQTDGFYGAEMLKGLPG
jgi:16S rRNA (cytosine967-C5)-methyltransferase